MSRRDLSVAVVGGGIGGLARDAQMVTSGDRSIAAIGWLYAHDASAAEAAAS